MFTENITTDVTVYVCVLCMQSVLMHVLFNILIMEHKYAVGFYLLFAWKPNSLQIFFFYLDRI